jgi:hypothetical protein
MVVCTEAAQFANCVRGDETVSPYEDLGSVGVEIGIEQGCWTDTRHAVYC